MTDEHIIKTYYKPLMEHINDIERRLDNYFGMRVDNVTPYTETKTAYIGDKEITFYDVPKGNVTVFFDEPYTLERVGDKITISFEELQEVKEVTISIL